MVFFILPGLQMFTEISNEKPLNGVYVEQELPELNIEQWLGFSFQQKMDKYLDQNFGFRPFFIRLFNQVDYTVFNRIHGHGIVKGKQNYLYEAWYITAYCRASISGAEKIKQTINKLSGIRDYLKQFNTKISVVLAPGKGHYYPEFIPNRYKKSDGKTDYDLYRDMLGESDISFFDVNDWFLQMKDTVSYPLFSQTGTHWSEFGAILVNDSILYYIEDLMDISVAHFQWKDTEISNEPRKADNDLEKPLNLFAELSNMTLAYPVVDQDASPPDDPKPSAIVISDSFFWHLFDGPFAWSFNEIKYWYYFNSIFPDSYTEKTTTKDIDIMDQLKNADLVILLISPSNLPNFGFGFVEKVDSLIQVNETIDLPDSVLAGADSSDDSESSDE